MSNEKLLSSLIGFDKEEQTDKFDKSKLKKALLNLKEGDIFRYDTTIEPYDKKFFVFSHVEDEIIYGTPYFLLKTTSGFTLHALDINGYTLDKFLEKKNLEIVAGWKKLK